MNGQLDFHGHMYHIVPQTYNRNCECNLFYIMQYSEFTLLIVAYNLECVTIRVSIEDVETVCADILINSLIYVSIF